MMMFMEGAIFTWLTADTELIAWTGHTSSSPNIYSAYPDNVADFPILAYWYEGSFNTIETIDELQTTLFNFGVWVEPRTTKTYNGWQLTGIQLCKRIIERIAEKLQPGNQADANLTNSQVRTKSVLYKNRFPVRHELEQELYRADITAEIKWHKIP